MGVGVGLLLAWLVLLIALLVARPSGNVITESLRLMPDLLRLVTRLARDKTLPRGVRLRLGLLLAYLAFPLQLIPDVVPVLGYADDVIAVLWVLHSVIRGASQEPIRRHWPGTPTGCEALLRLTRTRQSDRPPQLSSRAPINGDEQVDVTAAVTATLGSGQLSAARRGKRQLEPCRGGGLQCLAL